MDCMGCLFKGYFAFCKETFYHGSYGKVTDFQQATLPSHWHQKSAETITLPARPLPCTSCRLSSGHHAVWSPKDRKTLGALKNA